MKTKDECYLVKTFCIIWIQKYVCMYQNIKDSIREILDAIKAENKQFKIS